MYNDCQQVYDGLPWYRKICNTVVAIYYMSPLGWYFHTNTYNAAWTLYQEIIKDMETESK